MSKSNSVNYKDNYTTEEQTKRLMDIGLPYNTADFFYSIEQTGFTTAYYRSYPWQKRNDFFKTKKESEKDLLVVPSWSLGRLIEIYIILTNEVFTFILSNNDAIEETVKLFETHKDSLDFKKLK